MSVIRMQLSDDVRNMQRRLLEDLERRIASGEVKNTEPIQKQVIRMRMNVETGFAEREIADGINSFVAPISETPRRPDYYEYINSPEWRARADAAKERAKYRCQLCNSPDRLEAHHRTYERLGNEWPEDITVLCHDCHERYSTDDKENE